MTVAELIQQLQTLDQDKLIFVFGYEGGADDVGKITKIKVRLNHHTDWWMGKHDVIYFHDDGVDCLPPECVEGYVID